MTTLSSLRNQERQAQANPANTDANGAINRVSILSGSCYVKIQLLFEHNTKEDISIVKLNISNLHKTVIPWARSRETLIAFLCHYVIKTAVLVRCQNMSLKSTLHSIRCALTLGASTSSCPLNVVFFFV